MGVDAETQTVEPWPQVPAQETPTPPAEEKPPPPPPGGYPFYRAYIHLILPIAILILNRLTPHVLLLIPVTIVTYLIGSFIYPKHRLPPSPWLPEARRFSDKWWVYRVAILQGYDIFMSPPGTLSLSTLLQNTGLTYVTYNYFGLTGDMNDGRPPRHLWGSVFLKPALRVVASESLMYLLSRYVPAIAGFWPIRFIHSAFWREAMIALVDDVIGGLAYPDVRTKKGKAKVMGLQYFVFFCTTLRLGLRAREGATLETIAGLAGMTVQEMLKSGKTLEELLPSGTRHFDTKAAETSIPMAGKMLQKELGLGGEEDMGGLFGDLDLFDNE